MNIQIKTVLLFGLMIAVSCNLVGGDDGVVGVDHKMAAEVKESAAAKQADNAPKLTGFNWTDAMYWVMKNPKKTVTYGALGGTTLFAGCGVAVAYLGTKTVLMSGYSVLVVGVSIWKHIKSDQENKAEHEKTRQANAQEHQVTRQAVEAVRETVRTGFAKSTADHQLTQQKIDDLRLIIGAYKKALQESDEKAKERQGDLEEHIEAQLKTLSNNLIQQLAHQVRLLKRDFKQATRGLGKKIDDQETRSTQQYSALVSAFHAARKAQEQSNVIQGKQLAGVDRRLTGVGRRLISIEQRLKKSDEDRRRESDRLADLICRFGQSNIIEKALFQAAVRGEVAFKMDVDGCMRVIQTGPAIGRSPSQFAAAEQQADGTDDEVLVGNPRAIAMAYGKSQERQQLKFSNIMPPEAISALGFFSASIEPSPVPPASTLSSVPNYFRRKERLALTHTPKP